MTDKTFVISKKYRLSGIYKEDGARVYYDTDSHSGGYPYWSSFGQYKEFNSLDKVPTLKADDPMLQQVTSVEVLEVTTSARVISKEEMISDAKAKVISKIQQLQSDLDKEIAALENIK